jgi:hypothetical protein
LAVGAGLASISTITSLTRRTTTREALDCLVKIGLPEVVFLEAPKLNRLLPCLSKTPLASSDKTRTPVDRAYLEEALPTPISRL